MKFPIYWKVFKKTYSFYKNYIPNKRSLNDRNYEKYRKIPKYKSGPKESHLLNEITKNITSRRSLKRDESKQTFSEIKPGKKRVYKKRQESKENEDPEVNVPSEEL